MDATGDKLPAVILVAAEVTRLKLKSLKVRASRRLLQTRSEGTVNINESSQFASALKLSAKHGRWDVKVAGDDDEEAPYVTMTERLVDVFPWRAEISN